MLIDVVVLQSWPASVCVCVCVCVRVCARARACVCVYIPQFGALIWEKISVLESNFRNEQSLPYNHNLSKLLLAVEKTELSFLYSSIMYVNPKT
jgi:hypothetical protein